MRTTLKRLTLFLVFGLAIGNAQQLWHDWQFRSITPPSAAEMQQLADIWSRQNGQPVDERIRQALLEQELDERRVFREALRLGLHKKDPVVLRRLIQDARFLDLSGDESSLLQTAMELQLYQGDELIRRRLIQQMKAIAEGPAAPVSQEQLEADYQHFLVHRKAPWWYSFRHQFYRINTASGADAAYQRAQHDRNKLLAHDGEAQSMHNDAFLHGADFDNLNVQEIQQTFGSELAKAIPKLALKQWSEPLRSRYGWHLIQVQKRRPEPSPSLPQMRAKLLAKQREKQANQRWLDYRRALRDRYRIIES